MYSKRTKAAACLRRPHYMLQAIMLGLALAGFLGTMHQAQARVNALNASHCRTLVKQAISGSRQALRRLITTAGSGNVRWQLCLASMYYSQGDYARAVRWFAAGAHAGSVAAQFNLGVMYDNGRGVRRNKDQAAHWYRSAAVRGNPYAQYNLADLYEQGLWVPQRTARAAYWYRAAAKSGLALAQYRLGTMYHDGVGVKRNNEAALKWLRGAAEQGVVSAQYDLAVLFDSGQGMSRRHPGRAAYWYRAAAGQGDADAQNNLGIKYQSGAGVPRNTHKAAHWFRLAAEKGNANAQYNLGVMYAYGGGVHRNPVRADAWLTLAAASSLSREALRRGPRILKSRVELAMTLQQLQQAHKWAGVWLAEQDLLHPDRAQHSQSSGSSRSH